MPPRKAEHPTDAELEVLRVLWDFGPSTVRAVHDVLSEVRDVGYTTVLKVMQIMLEKELVLRDTAQRSHVYSAAVERAQTQRQLIDVLVGKVFNGATDQLVLRALNSRTLTAGEIAEVRRLLDEIELDDSK
jgi:predicted transcriptional regulator